MGHQCRGWVINVEVDQAAGQGVAEGVCGERGTHLTDLILVYSTQLQTVVYINTCTAHEEVYNNGMCEYTHTRTHLTAAPLAC